MARCADTEDGEHVPTIDECGLLPAIQHPASFVVNNEIYRLAFCKHCLCIYGVSAHVAQTIEDHAADTRRMVRHARVSPGKPR